MDSTDFEWWSGVFDIEFIGGTVKKNIRLTRKIIDTYGHPLWLVGLSELIVFPWSTIIQIVRVGD